MNEHNLKTIALKLSEALLLYKGEITIDDLKALPFIDENDAHLIAQYLQNKFNLRVHAKKTKESEWENVLSFK